MQHSPHGCPTLGGNEQWGRRRQPCRRRLWCVPLLAQGLQLAVLVLSAVEAQFIRLSNARSPAAAAAPAAVGRAGAGRNHAAHQAARAAGQAARGGC